MIAFNLVFTSSTRRLWSDLMFHVPILKLICLLVFPLEAVLIQRSKCGTSFPPGHFTPGKTIIPKSIQENNNVVVFPLPFHMFIPLVNLCLIRLQGQFSILGTRSCPDLYLLICSPRRPLALARGRILILGFIWFPSTLAIYDIAHSLPL